MAATITWQITELKYYPSKDDKSNLVYEVRWCCKGEEEKDGETYRALSSGNTTVFYNESSSFTAFEDLTEDQVLGWIWKSDADDESDIGKVNKTETEAYVQAAVDKKITPTSKTGLPSSW